MGRVETFTFHYNRVRHTVRVVRYRDGGSLGLRIPSLQIEFVLDSRCGTETAGEWFIGYPDKGRPQTQFTQEENLLCSIVYGGYLLLRKQIETVQMQHFFSTMSKHIRYNCPDMRALKNWINQFDDNYGFQYDSTFVDEEDRWSGLEIEEFNLISYRYETDEEYNRRVDKLKKMNDAKQKSRIRLKKMAEEKERAEFERLKKKFAGCEDAQ